MTGVQTCALPIWQTTKELVEQSRQMLIDGVVNAKQVAHSRILPVVEEAVDGEFEDVS